MNALELLSEVRRLGVRLWVDDGRLAYSAPNGVMASELRQELAGQRDELIRLLARPGKSSAQAIPAPDRMQRGAPSALSFAQERLWFLCQLAPEASPNLQTNLRWPGPLNVQALTRSLSEIVRRHETLRTTFEAVDGRPRQVIHAAEPVDVRLVDVRASSTGTHEAEAQRLAAEEGLRAFDLAEGPLFRAMLVRLADDDHVLVLTMHHIVSDGWSLGVLFRELAVLYEAFASGHPSPLPELPLQYADYAQWQRDWLQGEALEELLGYWRNQFVGAPAVLELPTDRPRPPVQSFRGAAQSFTVPARVTSGLRALSRSEEATLFMTLLAAFKVLLHRYTGQSDIVVGTPIAN